MAKEIKSVEKKSSDTALNSDWDYSVAERNMLSISPELKQELLDKGYDWRFINTRQFREKGNFHKNQWRPYHTDTQGPIEKFQGISPEGLVIRGDLVLAVRPKQLTSAYRKNLEAKNRAYQGINKAKAEELRQLSKSAGVAGQTKIFEGYDEN